MALRPLEARDAQAVQKYFPEWAIVKYLTKQVPWPYPPDGARDFIENVALPAMAAGDQWLWALTLKEAALKEAGDDEAVGIIHLRRHSKEGNRGFWLALPHHGKGLMTEAVTAVNDYTFGALGFERITIKNAKENAGSRRVKEKTGAVLLRTEPTDDYHGGYAESEVWELTAENWRKAREGKA
ncbi:MAG: GNAT family N-acetyltransferase [Alphaproteobacteria bacterium]|nr:GNAT family N-acetyltransferase [Alphaproteobacteria bacterium]